VVDALRALDLEGNPLPTDPAPGSRIARVPDFSTQALGRQLGVRAQTGARYGIYGSRRWARGAGILCVISPASSRWAQYLAKVCR
jgi:hypothetical protein